MCSSIGALLAASLCPQEQQGAGRVNQLEKDNVRAGSAEKHENGCQTSSLNYQLYSRYSHCPLVLCLWISIDLLHKGAGGTIHQSCAERNCRCVLSDSGESPRSKIGSRTQLKGLRRAWTEETEKDVLHLCSTFMGHKVW